MVVTTDSILAALKAGTYTLATLTTDRFFKVKQPEKRRRYPSVELIETKSLSNTGTQDSTDFIRVFEVRFYNRILGGQRTGQDDEIDSVETAEQELLVVLEATKFGEHKVVSEDKQWNRTTSVDKHPAYSLSTLTITIRRKTQTSTTPDGTLIFDLSLSTVDNAPADDYTYTSTFDTDITSGHSDIDEQVAQDANPRRYAGGFSGTFITHVKVKTADLGTTGDKINQLNTLRSNGEKPIVTYIYSNKDATTPSPKTIQKSVKLTVEDVTETYKSGDVTIYRILGKILEPTTTTVI